MGKLLEQDAKVLKEFGIDTASDLEDEMKIGHVRSQVDEFKKVLWRERVELLISLRQVEKATDDIIKNQHQGKVSERRLMIKQFTHSVEVLTELLHELESKVS